MNIRLKRIVVGVILIGLLVLAVFVARSRTPSGGNVAQPAQKVSSGKMYGPPTAPITIVEFSDFECPSCARAQETLIKLLEQFPNVIQVQFRNFPLSMHAYAYEAAKWVECAADQGKFFSFHELLFHERNVWPRDPDTLALFRAYANSEKLNPRQLERCLNDPETVKRVESDKEMGYSLQVNSTPTFFINGERLVGSQQLEQKGPAIIENLLASSLEQKKEPAP